MQQRGRSHILGGLRLLFGEDPLCHPNPGLTRGLGQVIAGGEDAEKFSHARRISELESARPLRDWVYGEKNRGGQGWHQSFWLKCLRGWRFHELRWRELWKGRPLGLALEALDLMCLTAVHREMSGAELEVQTGCKHAGCLGNHDIGAAHQECKCRQRRPGNGQVRALGSENVTAVSPFSGTKSGKQSTLTQNSR